MSTLELKKQLVEEVKEVIQSFLRSYTVEKYSSVLFLGYLEKFYQEIVYCLMF